MRRRSSVLVLAVLVSVLVSSLFATTAFAKTTSGQALSVRKLPKAVLVRKGVRSTMTFTIRNAKGSKVTGYATSKTKYYERGPNDAGYHGVGRSEAYTVFVNWGGGGSCPAKLVYRKYRYHGTTRKVLTKVYFFLQGE